MACGCSGAQLRWRFDLGKGAEDMGRSLGWLAGSSPLRIGQRHGSDRAGSWYYGVPRMLVGRDLWLGVEAELEAARRPRQERQGGGRGGELHDKVRAAADMAGGDDVEA